MSRHSDINKSLTTLVSQPWKQFSLAQSKEDIWLYENWYFNIENGVIMESGGLDGLTYSTSYLFEKYLNWTSIHIGKQTCNILKLNSADVFNASKCIKY